MNNLNLVEPCSPDAVINDITEHTSITCDYYCLLDIDNSLCDGYKYCALHLNIHSLCAKHEQLIDIIHTLYQKKIVVHFVMLCETFLNDLNSSLYNIEGYNLVYENRKQGRGGGLAIYVLDTLTFQKRDDLMINIDREFESLVLEITDSRFKFIVGEIYRVPNSNVKDSLDRF